MAQVRAAHCAGEGSHQSLVWRRPAQCSSSTCVEVAVSPDGVYLRDGKDPAGPTLSFTPEEWREFVAAVTAGEFTSAIP